MTYPMITDIDDWFADEDPDYDETWRKARELFDKYALDPSTDWEVGNAMEGMLRIVFYLTHDYSSESGDGFKWGAVLDPRDLEHLRKVRASHRRLHSDE